MTEPKLIERQSRAVHDEGQTRLPRDFWRALDGDDSAEMDLVELEDGSKEVRIRSTQ